jgi:hypothetical protein
MGDREKIGARVDAELWQEFREYVENRHGQTRGVLGRELENAIRNYIHYGPDRTLAEQVAEFNDRLQRVEGALGTAPTDGGSDTLDGDSHTHAPSTDPPTEKPASTAATEKKVRWLAHQLREQRNLSGTEAAEFPRSIIRDVVKSEYGFRRDTAQRYVEELIDHFDLHDHPDPNLDLLVTEPKLAQLREQQRADAEDELDDLSDHE